MALLIVGPKPATAANSWHFLSPFAGGQRAIVLPDYRTPADGWVVRLGAFVRRTGGNPFVVLALRERLADGSPGALWARSGAVGVPNVVAGGAVEAAVAWTGPVLASAPGGARLPAGSDFLLEIGVRNGYVDVAALAGEPATTHWWRTVASGWPTDPALPEGGEPGPALGLWLVLAENEAPAAPASLSPAAGASSNTDRPVFAGGFVDANAAPPAADGLREYRLEVRDAATLAGLWSGAAATFAATPAERAAARFSREYAGPPLAGGQVVEWQATVADDHLLAGPESAWRTLTINALGQVDTADGTPAGKVDGDPAQIAWSARWHQPQGHAADRVRVRVLRSGQLWRQGPEVVKAVASSAPPGTAFSVSAAEAGIGALAPGEYAYDVAARDATTGAWSPPSAPRPFAVNSPPTTPSNLQPPSGSASTSRPLLEWGSVDPDADDVEGVDVDWEIEITRPDGSKATRFTAAYDGGRGVASYRPTAVDWPGFGVYTQRVRGRDLSAGARGHSPWSASWAVAYVAGPVVAITNPSDGEVVETAVPTVAWGVTGGAQAASQVILYRGDSPVAAKASARTAGGLGLLSVPPGWLANGEWDLVVQVWDAANLLGTSERRRFSVAFAPPAAPPGVTVTADAAGASVLVTWPPSQYPPGEVKGWRVTRRPAGAAPEEASTVAVIDSPVAGRWRDDHAPPDEPLTYALTQLRDLGGGEVLESEPVEATVQLDLGGGAHATIVAVADPAKRAVLALMKRGDDPAGGVSGDGQTITVWGAGGKPIPAPGAGSGLASRSWSGALLGGWDGDDGGEAALRAAEALVGAGVVSVRDRRGRLWAEVVDVSWTRIGHRYEVTIEAAERGHVEGEDG